MSRSEQTGVTIGLVVIGLFFAGLVTLPTRMITFTVLGSELALRFTTQVQFGTVMTLLVCFGSELIIRSHPALPDKTLGYTFTFWILPGVITYSSFMLAPTVTGWPLRIAFIGLVSLMLYVVLALQYHSLDTDEGRAWPARLALQIAVYLAALLFYIVISSSAMRALISATSVLFVSAMLSLELVRELESRSTRIWLYAFVVGLMMSELKWSLNYIKLDARVAGAFLLLAFYTLTGLTRSMLQKRLTNRVVLEYIFVALAGAFILLFLNRWL